MALINPVHAFIVPFLVVATTPLAILAVITTTLAFSILLCRVIVVYLGVALSLVPSYLGNHTSRPRRRQRHLEDSYRRLSSATSSTYSTHSTHSNENISPTMVTQQQTLYRRRHRRPSNVSAGTVTGTSIVSAGSTTPVGDTGLGLMPSVGAERDFEGIGGWRSAQDDDDETWTTINSRFEYPDRTYTRSHHRTPSGGPATPGESGLLMMKSARGQSPEGPPSPNSSRARTPSVSRTSVASMANSDGHFPLGMSPTISKKLTTHPT
ncbi:hypothetical protein DCS_00738 [Drechmeria coniospora]|uniref:Uncharacterized protein n=1 Tax=Drechmeria coniospora TaxID=98403 RepID=A0A151GR79_DRECN|nr:hypothetical protein DCS_00738 [Drechmeria coniospora]KYK59606.1 hypothetical protein DCS_00738 [Drechmeria coniospora]ODA76702.1 hypothetical protein RJ55_07973 [Drechmeria coniospora]